MELKDAVEVDQVGIHDGFLEIRDATDYWKRVSQRNFHSHVPKSLDFFILSELSSFYIVIRSLCIRWIETLAVCAMAASAPIFFSLYQPNGEAMRYNQSWSMLSFLLVFPLTQSMTAAFNRRERAIQFLQAFKCSCMALFLSHTDWDYYDIPTDKSQPVTGLRDRHLKNDHVDRLTRSLLTLTHLLNLILLSPSIHVMHLLFATKVEMVGSVTKNLRRELAKTLQDISMLGEELKMSGVPASEATRIRQFSYTAMDAYNNLIAIKAYHTPLGLRAFTRVFILLVPWLFGPYWGAMSASVGLGFTIAFSVVQSLALKSLFIMRFALEDPFIVGNIALPRRAKDAIDVQGELEELKEELEMLLARKRAKGGGPGGEVLVVTT